MITEVVLLQLGETMNEGTIASWYKAEGDRVEKGEALCGIETDKAVLDIEAPVGGYLARILVPAGQTAPVLQTIGLIADRLEEVQVARAAAGPAGAVVRPEEAASVEAPRPTTVGGVRRRAKGRFASRPRPGGSPESTGLRSRASAISSRRDPGAE